MEPPPSPRTLQNRDTISIQRILVLGGGGGTASIIGVHYLKCMYSATLVKMLVH